MNETDAREAGPVVAPDPERSPFPVPQVEGKPYEKGSDEDRAIKRIIERDSPAAEPDTA